MGLLSNISGKKAVKIFGKFGYILDHHTGSREYIQKYQNNKYRICP